MGLAPNDLAAGASWWLRWRPAARCPLQQRSRAADTVAANARPTQARGLAGEQPVCSQIALRVSEQVFRHLRQSSADQLRITNFRPCRMILSRQWPSRSEFAGRVRRTIECAASAERLRPISRMSGCCSTAVWRPATQLRSSTRAGRLCVIAFQRRALELATARHDLGAASGLDVAQQQALLTALRRSMCYAGSAISSSTLSPPCRYSRADLCASPRSPQPIPRCHWRAVGCAGRRRCRPRSGDGAPTPRSASLPRRSILPSFWRRRTSRHLSALFSAPSLPWSVGVSRTADIRRGTMRANLVRAGYDFSVANYRVVLTAMQRPGRHYRLAALSIARRRRPVWRSLASSARHRDQPI